VSESAKSSFALPALVLERAVSATDVAAKTIRDAILRNEVAPGQRLVQAEVAEMLGVSRQPVREAFRRLESEGLVTAHVRGGVVVREYSEAEVAENYHLRTLLESEAASLAAGRITLPVIDGLRVTNAELEAAWSRGELDAVSTLNSVFHEQIRQAAGMPLLKQVIDTLWVGYSVFTPIFVPGRAERSVAEHARIIEALNAHDSPESAAAMREHIGAGFRDYSGRAPASADGSRKASSG